MKLLMSGYLLLVLAGAVQATAAEEAEAERLPVVTPGQLDNFQFRTNSQAPEARIEELSVSQRHIMNVQRREARDLFARELGILHFDGRRSDLGTLQRLVDRQVLGDDKQREWQSVGVLFGDILVREMGLHWVSYEDERGISKALQWRKTKNFVFPVTVFSKRAQYGEDIEVQVIYEAISADIEAFIARETRLGR